MSKNYVFLRIDNGSFRGKIFWSVGNALDYTGFIFFVYYSEQKNPRYSIEIVS